MSNMRDHSVVSNMFGLPFAFPSNGPFKSEDYNNLVNGLCADINRVANDDNIVISYNDDLIDRKPNGAPGSFVYLPYISSYDEIESMRSEYWNTVMLPMNIFPFSSKLIKETHISQLRFSPAGRKMVYQIINIGYASKYAWYWDAIWTATQPTWITSKTDIPGMYNVQYSAPEWLDIIERQIKEALRNGVDGIVIDGLQAAENDVNHPVMDKYEYVVDVISDMSTECDIVAVDTYSVVASAMAGSYTDGIIKENVYYNSQTARTSSEVTLDVNYLDTFTDNDKSVYVVEHIEEESQQIVAQENCKYKGYALYISGLDPSTVFTSSKYAPIIMYSMNDIDRIRHYYKTSKHIRRTWL